MTWIWNIFLFSIISIISFACQENPLTADTFHTIKVGQVTLKVEIATTPDMLEKGLMYRKQLPAGEGMLFIHPYPQRLTYWMKNTFIPLDIGFFDENGILMEIYPLYPQDLTPISSKNEYLKYALEVPQGWFNAMGIQLGDHLNL